MLAFLVVEDEVAHYKPIVEFLTDEFPGCRVDHARSIAEAARRLREAEDQNLTYKVAVLDFRLPRRRGDATEEVDLETRKAVVTSPATEEAAVFHITGYANDEEIRRYIQEKRLDRPNLPYPFLIEKKGEWTEVLYRAIRRLVHGERIAARLDRLFSPRGGRGGSSQRADLPATGSLTQEMNALTRDVELHWPYLSESLQERVRQLFEVHPHGQTVRVSLT